jgi:SAM-dependent methyltransferase
MNAASPILNDSHPYAELRTPPLALEPVSCCVCDSDDADPVGVGEDFEYDCSPDTFLMVRCRGCGLMYLNPRPALDELPRIYPPTYHSLDFSAEKFGFVYTARSRLEAMRLLRWCRGLPDDARIIDVGCGDGFHLRLLRRYGKPGWRLEGVEPSERAAAMAGRAGIRVHRGIIQQVDLPSDAYDLALLIQTIEHVDAPLEVLREVRRILKPGGRVVLVTDNVDTLDFRIFRGRHWGGYHFPRHWSLFDRRTLRALAERAGLQVDAIGSMVTPVNWVLSIHNLLQDWGAPRWLVNRFSVRSPISLGVFTAFDTLWHLVGRGALLQATLSRPG